MKKKEAWILFFLLFMPPFYLLPQNIIINSEFKKINICSEYTAPCNFMGWYTIGSNWFSPLRLKNHKLCGFYNAYSDSTPLGRMYLIGSLVKPVFAYESYTLKINLFYKQSFILRYQFLPKFLAENDFDTPQFRNFEFKELKIENSKCIIIPNLKSLDTSLFIIFSARPLKANAPMPVNIYFQSIELISEQKINLSFYLFSERYKFILNDKRRHIFSNSFGETNFRRENSMMNMY